MTGTLIDGSLRVGAGGRGPAGRAACADAGPSDARAEGGDGAPGRRTAVNLAGVAVDQLERGMVVATPGWLRPVTVGGCAAPGRALPGPADPAQPSVTFHTGAAEAEGKLLLLDAGRVGAGRGGWAQVRLRSRWPS